MTTLPSPAITLAGLSFARPDGTAVLEGHSGTFGTGRTGLIGDNGSGTSTLLRQIEGAFAPSSGTAAPPTHRRFRDRSVDSAE